MNRVELAKAKIIILLITAFGTTVGIATTFVTFSPSSAEKIDKVLNPFIDNISPFQWGVISLVICVLTFSFYSFSEKYILRSKIDVQPHLYLVQCGVDDVGKNIDFYGKKSFVAYGLRGKKDLVFFDIANAPPKREKGKSDAEGVLLLLEFFDYETGMPLYKRYIAKWVKPENKDRDSLGIAIPADQIGRRVGVGFMEFQDGTLWLLDAGKAYIEEGCLYPRLDHISGYGEFGIVATFMGSDIWGEQKVFFRLSKFRDEPLRFVEMEDGEDWYQRAKFSYSHVWSFDNK